MHGRGAPRGELPEHVCPPVEELFLLVAGTGEELGPSDGHERRERGGLLVTDCADALASPPGHGDAVKPIETWRQPRCPVAVVHDHGQAGVPPPTPAEPHPAPGGPDRHPPPAAAPTPPRTPTPTAPPPPPART